MCSCWCFEFPQIFPHGSTDGGSGYLDTYIYVCLDMLLAFVCSFMDVPHVDAALAEGYDRG
jgi:hypothetical protein